LGRITWDVVPGESPMATKKGRCQALRANHARLETIYGAIG